MSVRVKSICTCNRRRGKFEENFDFFRPSARPNPISQRSFSVILSILRFIGLTTDRSPRHQMRPACQSLSLIARK